MRTVESLDELISKKAAEFADQIKAAAATADKEEEIRIESERQLAFIEKATGVRLEGKPLSPEHIAGDFGSEAKLAREGIRALYEAIAAADQPKAQTCFNQWKVLFGEVCRYDVDRPSGKIKKLAESYGVPIKGVKPAEMLFALHSYYALFMKLLASEIVAFFHKLPSPSRKMTRAGTSGKLKREMEDLEAGSIFRHLNITNFLEGDLFGWYMSVWSEPIEKLVRSMAARLDDYNTGTLPEDPAGSRDLLKKLYQQLFPKSVRHDLGEYYTPDWLAEHVLNELGYVGDPDKRLLDPACGSGTFLVMAINRVRAWFEENRERCGFDEGELCRKVLANVIGFDLNPLAVMAARTNYLIAIRDLIGRVDKVEMPVYLCDSIMTPSEQGGRFGPGKSLFTRQVDFVAGNPPWINWSNLPEEYRENTAPIWQKYNLFPHRGLRARTGSAMDDISALLTYVCMDSYLKPQGVLGFVITQTIFKTEGGGEGFRQFKLSAGEPMRVVSVSDFSSLQPFEGATNRTATMILQKGSKTTYPVPYTVWEARSKITQTMTLAEVKSVVKESRMIATPVSPSKSTSPWIVGTAKELAAARKCLGPSDYQGRYGTHCHASGIYWVEVLDRLPNDKVLVRNLGEVGKNRFPSIEHRVDGKFIYPLARGRDVDKWSVAPRCWMILAQDSENPSKAIPEGALRRQSPDTFDYFARFEAPLRARSGYKKFFRPGIDPFYSVYNVGVYTFSRYKVLWREVAQDLRAAVSDGTGEPLVPDHTLVSVATESLDEAHYLCAMLNNTLANYIVTNYVALHPAPHILKYIKVQEYQRGNGTHRRLAQLSSRCHIAMSEGDTETVRELESEVDRVAAKVWGIDSEELKAIREPFIRY